MTADCFLIRIFLPIFLIGLIPDGIELSDLINFIGYRHTSLQAWHSLLLRLAMHWMIVKECCVFIAKYRITVTGDISIIPHQECPPFPGQMEGFYKALVSGLL
jgi:hypothetical protein